MVMTQLKTLSDVTKLIIFLVCYFGKVVYNFNNVENPGTPEYL